MLLFCTGLNGRCTPESEAIEVLDLSWWCSLGRWKWFSLARGLLLGAALRLEALHCLVYSLSSVLAVQVVSS